MLLEECMKCSRDGCEDCVSSGWVTDANGHDKRCADCAENEEEQEKEEAKRVPTPEPPPPRLVTIVVSGSREWKASFPITCEFEKLLEHYENERVVYRLVHGACKGLDTLAAHLAKHRGWEVIACPAFWKQGAKGAPLRNQYMLDEYAPDACIAFPYAESKGTRDMIRRMEAYVAKAGKPVYMAVREGVAGRDA